MPYLIEPMTQADVDEVSAVERECFATPWPTSAYRRELRTPESNRYIVARYIGSNGRRRGGNHDEPGWRQALERVLPWLIPAPTAPASPYPIAGFAGLWLMVDEAHVTTIGVAPEHRGKHIGEMLFLALIDIAMQMKANWLTLEVRVSNTVAQNLYRKYGMQIAGTRKRYYSDNGEDAYIMWSEPLSSPAFQERLAKLRAAFEERRAVMDAAEGGPAPVTIPVRPAPERNA
jgi:[ribosomal protein S18]-alanine N-acetyltransferase